MSNVSPKSVDILQETLSRLYNDCRSSQKRYARERLWRLGLAYILRGTAIFSGVAITFIGTKGLVQLLGLAIVLAGSIDTWLSNHWRLIATDDAAKAYDPLIRACEVDLNQKIAEVVSINQMGDQPEAVGVHTKVLNEYINLLKGARKEIEAAFAERDTQALHRLSARQEVKNAG